MRKYPKYIVLPCCMLVYFIVMSVMGWKMNHWQMPEDFVLTACGEVAIIIILFFSLRYLHRRRQKD